MQRLQRRKLLGGLVRALTSVAALLVIGVLVLVLGHIVAAGLAKLNLDFLINTPRPLGDPSSGIANAIVGTAILLLVASAVGLPVGVLAGLYLAEFGANRTGRVLRFLVEVLSGVPSIIVGVFVWSVLVRRMGRFSALAGGIALAIIMVPIVARTTEEMLRLVPHNLREAALALGAPVWRVSLGVVLRPAAGGVATGAMLAIARAAGETAPLLLTALSYNYMSTDLDQPIASLTYQIFYYAGSPYEQWHSLAWAATLVLVAMIAGINAMVRIIWRPPYQ